MRNKTYEPVTMNSLEYKWVIHHYGDKFNFTLDQFSTLESRIDVCVKILKTYINETFKTRLDAESSDITPEFHYYINKYMEIENSEHNQNVRDEKTYILQFCLLCRGYNSDLNGCYTRFTHKTLNAFKRDTNNHIIYSGCDPTTWVMLLDKNNKTTCKEEEN